MCMLKKSARNATVFPCYLILLQHLASLTPQLLLMSTQYMKYSHNTPNIHASSMSMHVQSKVLVSKLPIYFKLK